MSEAPTPMGLYPHTRRVGNFLFLSGVGPRSGKDNSIPQTFEAQVHAVFENVKIILQEAGSAWDELVDVTVYLTDMKNQFPIYNKIYAEYFKTNQPCRTTLGITALPSPISIELKCLAVLK
jgi:2-aminomuconate deaminase